MGQFDKRPPAAVFPARGVVIAGLIWLGSLLLATAAVGAEDKPGAPPSLDAFFEDPTFDHAALSPDGRYVAIAQGGDIKAVTVTDLETGTTTPILSLDNGRAAVKGMEVDWIRWKSDDRLIVGLTLLDIQRLGGKPDGEILSWRYGQYVLAIDRNGKNSVSLLKGDFWNSDRGRVVALLDRLPNDPDHVLVTAPNVAGDPEVWKVDIHSGQGVRIENGDTGIIDWGTDSNGTVVTRARESGSTFILEGRAPGETRWTTIVRLRPKDFKAMPDFQILGGTGKPGQIYVAVNPKTKDEGDTRTLRIYDLVTKTLSAPVWPTLKYDLDDIVQDQDTSALEGVCYTEDVYVCDMKDPVIAANFRGIAKFFQGDRSLTPISTVAGGRWWLFEVSGPDEPDSYYLFDWKTKGISELAEEFAHLPTSSLARMDRWTYASRDGAQIPAYLTRPKDAKGPMPLIVMPHGGPEARDSFGFDRWGQYLATRGYLVFQPNFRG